MREMQIGRRYLAMSTPVIGCPVAVQRYANTIFQQMTPVMNC
jgi:hypothetical protein